MRRWTHVVLAAALLAGCEAPKTGTPLSGGGGKPDKLVAARVDTGVILQTNPAYQEMAQAYLKEQMDMRMKVAKDLEALGNDKDKQSALRVKSLKQQREMNDKWVKRTQDFIDDTHKRMRGAVESICKEKGIDLVVIDTKVYPTVEYGALDITQEVIVKLENPTASPAPEGSPK